MSGKTPGSLVDSNTCYDLRRTVPRYAFVAVAEIAQTASETGIQGRVAEISRKGCYVDVLNSFPVGTVLNTRIFCDRGSFAAKGRVLYVQERIGMGIAFLDPPADELKILDAWLSELSVRTT
jgi:PilZ domain-containing protein